MLKSENVDEILQDEEHYSRNVKLSQDLTTDNDFKAARQSVASKRELKNARRKSEIVEKGSQISQNSFDDK